MNMGSADGKIASEWPSETVDFLLSAAAEASLDQLQNQDLREERTIALISALRRMFSSEQAGALLTLARLRQKAAAKFSGAERLYFTSEALEQATAQAIAIHRAEWIQARAPAGTVLDLGCGIGGDTLALARYRPVVAYECAPDRVRLAAANVAQSGCAHHVEFRQQDWTTDLAAGKLPQAAAAFADPARRVDGRRVFSLHEMQPPLSQLLQLQQQISALGVKVAPGVADEEIPSDCSVEFISHERTCKEAVLWFGPLAVDGIRRWASVHDGATWHRLEASLQSPPQGMLSPGDFLHEPDGAVIRAGAFAELCDMLDAHLFDAQIAYLVGSRPSQGTPAAPFVQTFQIEEILPGSLKQLNQRLRALQIGTVELKKRGAPLEPESLRPRLKLTPGGREATIFFTRQGDQRLTLLGHRV